MARCGWTGREGVSTPLFLVGYGRSGTTLLRSVLAQHSRIHLVNEPELIFALRYAGYRTGDSLPHTELPSLPDRLGAIGLCRNHLHRLPAEVLEQLTASKTQFAFGEVYEKLLPVPDGDVIWGEKSLNNIFFVQDLLGLYPDARFVEIIRDPRAVCLSYLIKQKKAASASRISWWRCLGFTARHLLLWRQWILAGRAARERAGDRQWLTITYENFLTHPQDTLEGICRLLDLPFEPAMLDHERRGDDQVFTGGGAFAHQNIKRPFDTSRITAYRQLPPHFLALADRLAGDLMNELGYPPCPITLTPRQRVLLATALRLRMTKVRKQVDDKVARRHPTALP